MSVPPTKLTLPKLPAFAATISVPPTVAMPPFCVKVPLPVSPTRKLPPTFRLAPLLIVYVPRLLLENEARSRLPVTWFVPPLWLKLATAALSSAMTSALAVSDPPDRL